MRLIRPSVVILLVLLLTGCASLQKRPALKIIYLPDTSATSLREGSILNTLRVSANLKAKGAPSAKAVITVKAPDSIRVELYGAMHRLLLVVTGDKGRCESFRSGAVKECEWEDQSIDSELGYLPNPSVLVPFLLNTKGHSPLKVEVGQGGELTLKLSATKYADVGAGLSIPINIKMESPGGVLAMDYRSVEINPKVDGAAFQLPLKATL